MIPVGLPIGGLVLVSWVDSNFQVGWHPHHAQTAKMPRSRTAGFVTFNNEEILEVAGSLGEEGGKLNPLSIPWISIEKLEILKDPEPEPPAGDAGRSAGMRPRFDAEDESQDLPETVEDDADFNFRKLQLELGERVN